jgi:hypothetical protein
MAGAELQHFYPVSTIADGQGLNMTVQSYNGNLDFGFVACRELVPDVWMLTDLLQDSMNELLVAANKAVAQPAAKAASKAAKPKRKAATKSTTKAAGKSTTKAAARKAS